MIHKLQLEPNLFHGSFNREYKPILTVQSGDSIQLSTLDIQWGYSKIPGQERTIYSSREQEEKPGHPMVGPIKIEGARPGMVLEVKLNDIVPGWYGRNWAGGMKNWQNEKLGLSESQRVQLDWRLDTNTMLGRCVIGNKTFEVPLMPFMGLMALAPLESGTHPTPPPGYFGGNIDCKELIKGSSLFLPISVEGGLFSIGDGHALQGDGEVSGTAIECPMDLVDITLTVRNDMSLNMPIAKTPSGWITFGFDEDLNEAAATALSEMVQLLQQFFGLQKSQALAIASVAVDLRVTQVVNGVKGVHAVLSDNFIKVTEGIE
ncbi:acetamidase/formamidase family protein [Peribacillus sp. SCS-155]|uniref:acetamidase/formamidase family protein n=1 Tax=Peribacillus sedimenti TaxID=3115297 RepID=UPI003905BF31